MRPCGRSPDVDAAIHGDARSDARNVLGPKWLAGARPQTDEPLRGGVATETAAQCFVEPPHPIALVILAAAFTSTDRSLLLHIAGAGSAVAVSVDSQTRRFKSVPSLGRWHAPRCSIGRKGKSPQRMSPRVQSNTSDEGKLRRRAPHAQPKNIQPAIDRIPVVRYCAQSSNVT